MNKKRLLTSVMAMTLAFTGISATACGPKPTGEGIDRTKTQLYVGVYVGGWGSDWIHYLKTEFERQYPNVQIVLDEKKLEFESTTLIASIADGINDMYFTNIYSHDYVKGESNENLLLDVTDVVTTPIRDIFAQEITLDNGTKVVAADQTAFANETQTIEQKMDPYLSTYYKSSSKNGDKYFGIPHSGSTMNLNYDVDLWEEKGWFISDYIEEDDEYVWTTGLEGAPKKWAGQDGVEGTYDDGLPITYEDFKAMCAQIKRAQCDVLTYGHNMAQYRERYLATIMAQYLGADEFALGYSQNGHSTEFDMDITADNAYELQKTEAKKAMLTVAYDFAKNGWISSHASTDDYTAAQNNFVGSKYDAQLNRGKRIAMILEGSWWENEAKATLEANKLEYNDPQDRRFGIMTIPYFNGTEGIKNQTNTQKTTVAGSADVGIYIRKNAQKAEIAKKFMAFAIVEKNLKETTRLTGEVKPYTYNMGDVLSTMSYYKQATWDNLKGSGVERTYQVGPSVLMKNNRQYFTYHWICEAPSTAVSKDNVSRNWTDPFRFFGEYGDFVSGGNYNVADYCEALTKYHQTNWENLTR